MAEDRFADRVFRGLPLAALAVAAAAGGLLGPGWSTRAAAIPWLIALAVVGLAHGATDFAVSRRLCPAAMLAPVWATYATIMAAVVGAYWLAPIAVLVLFVLLSTWHFGHAAAEAGGPGGGGSAWPVWAAALARGGWMLGVPLAAWPAATAGVAADLLRLTGHGELAAAAPLAVTATRGFGLALVAAAAAAAVGEWVAVARQHDRTRCRQRLASELAATAALGLTTDPLFSVGMMFLVWHAWRQMEPLAVRLAGGSPTSWPQLGTALVRIHAAALPLLVPAWVVIGGAWWLRSPAHSAHDLAILSIAAYGVVTPAHECLGWMLCGRPHQEPAAPCPRSSVSCSA